MSNIKIELNEINFTHVCKTGSLSYGHGYDRIELRLTSKDMIALSNSEVVIKESNMYSDIFEISIVNIEKDVIREIIKRSPIFSQLYYDIH